MLVDLSLNLKGVVAQRLVPGVSGKRVPATEVMLLSAYVGELIQKGDVDEIMAVIAKSNEIGMHSFDQSLYDLYQRGEITLAQALEHADSRTDLSLRVRLSAGVAVEAPANLSPLRKKRLACTTVGSCSTIRVLERTTVGSTSCGAFLSAGTNRDS